MYNLSFLFDNVGPGSKRFEESDHHKSLEDEHLHLQRQFRHLVAAKSMLSGTHPKLRSAYHQYDMLKKEFVHLKKDIKLSKSGRHRVKDSRMSRNVGAALLMHDQLQLDLDMENNQVTELNALIHSMRNHVLRLREKQPTDTDVLASKQSSDARVSQEENRLEVANKRFDRVHYQNEKLRHQIQRMLSDRANFNLAWTKSISSLCEGKKFLHDLIEQSSLACDQREEWVRKLQFVQEKGKLDLMLQIQEMRSLQKYLNQNLKLRDFLKIKGTIRVPPQSSHREEELNMEKRQKEQEDLVNMMNVLTDIRELTGEGGVNDIILNFRRRECLNEQIFKLLLDQLCETKALCREIAKLKQAIQDRDHWNRSMMERRLHDLNQVNLTWHRAANVTAAFRGKAQRIEDTIESATKGTKDIFEMLQCSETDFPPVLGEKGPVMKNCVLALEIIEQAIRKYFLWMYCQERGINLGQLAAKGKQAHKFVGDIFVNVLRPNTISSLVKAEPCSICVEAREMARVSETSEMPLSREQAVRLARRGWSDRPPSERLHELTMCRMPASRALLTKQYI